MDGLESITLSGIMASHSRAGENRLTSTRNLNRAFTGSLGSVPERASPLASAGLRPVREHHGPPRRGGTSTRRRAAGSAFIAPQEASAANGPPMRARQIKATTLVPAGAAPGPSSSRTSETRSSEGPGTPQAFSAGSVRSLGRPCRRG
jgi:hypothetical protein